MYGFCSNSQRAESSARSSDDRHATTDCPDPPPSACVRRRPLLTDCLRERQRPSLPDDLPSGIRLHGRREGLLKVWLTPDLWGREPSLEGCRSCLDLIRRSSARTSWPWPGVGTLQSSRSPRTSGSPTRVCATGCMLPMSRTVTVPARARRSLLSCASSSVGTGCWSRRTRSCAGLRPTCLRPVSYTHLRAHETDSYLVCRL